MKIRYLLLSALIVGLAACATSPDTTNSATQEAAEADDESTAEESADTAAGDVDADTDEELIPGEFCDPGNIRQVVTEASSHIRHCFEKELQDDPELEGRVDINWIIYLDGSTRAVSVVESGLDSEEVESCIAAVIEEMQFAEPDGGICEINFPFVFHGLSNSSKD